MYRTGPEDENWSLCVLRYVFECAARSPFRHNNGEQPLRGDVYDVIARDENGASVRSISKNELLHDLTTYNHVFFNVLLRRQNRSICS